MKRPRFILFGLVSGLVVLAASVARADEPARVRVETEGDCPTSRDLETALASLAIGTDGVGDTAWIVRAIHPPRGATRLELWPPAASEPVERRAIASPDCEALAQTFALIVHTHFTELGLQVAPPTPPPPVDEVFPEDEPSVVMAVTPRAPTPIPTRWEIGIGVLGGISVDPLLPSLLAQADVSYLPEASGPFVLRVSFAASAPTSQNGGLDAISRWALRPGIEAGARFGGESAWFQILGGLVVDVAAISAVGVPLFWRAQPGLDLALGVGIHLADGVWLRIEASEQLWLTYDRYLINPDGLVARSPQSSTVLGVSLLFAFDH